MSEQVAQSKEQQILEAAEREFLEKGYDGARTTSIAKAAGVTHAMLHYYFRTKEQLFERFIDKKMSEVVPLLTHLFGNSDLPLVERIEKTISVHFDFVATNPDLPRFLINEILPYKERCDLFYSKVANFLYFFNNLQREVNEAAARGEVEQFNVLLLFQSVLSLNIFPSLMINMIENLMSNNEQSMKEIFAQPPAPGLSAVPQPPVR